nr:4-coumarate--CoA ligase 1-like isoform X2 [Drosophila kikkawai]
MWRECRALKLSWILQRRKGLTNPFRPEPLREGGDQTVAMLCSSGTTALPKAVCISNSRLMPLQGVSSGSVIFTWGTLSWISGLWGLVNSTALNCTRIISRKPFSAEYLVHLVENYKINVIGLPPSHVYDLVNCPMATSRSLGSIRLLICGGGVASTAILQRCQKLCENGTVSNTYAMSETGTICRAGGLTHGGTVGRPVPGYRIRIVDEQGVSQGHNQIGEIYVHSGLGWKGYYGNSEESRRMQDPDGWFHTGDLGYFDEQNFLFVVDRKKEILKYQQRPYWPAEIEKVILELPQVENVCVVGIFDEEVGDKAGALVVRSNETNISAKEIVNHVAKRLPELRRQLHAGVKFTNKLPLNANGKIMRKEARDLFNALGDLSNDKF